MELHQLEAFRAVATEGSFSRAAQKLRLTQPAVSQIIRNLESEIGEKLFDRSSRDGVLTDAGQLLLDYAEKLLNLRGETWRALSEMRELHSGRLLLAANEFTSMYLLRVLDEYRRLYPMIKVTVQRSFASQIPRQVLTREVELGVVSFRPDDLELRSIVVYRDELAFVVPPKHPFARLRSVSIRQLGSQAFVAHQVASPYRARVLEAFKRHETVLCMPVELPTIEAIKRFVSMGNGVALVPGLCVEKEVASGELARVPVPELHFERKLRVVHRHNAHLSHPARAFLDALHRLAQESDSPFLYQRES
jgi:DNA-binding transcriptional LysR family regulator